MCVGGGVWRTKWTVAGGCSFLTLACMQAGSKVYALASDYSVHGVCEHSGAESNELSYGIDILSADTNTLIIGSCSFYNNSVHVWESSFSN